MSKIKILLVDDETDILNILKYSLENEGYEVYICNDSNNAIQLAQKIIPDIFILDVMMPKKSGFVLCEMIRQIEIFKNKYIFFLTALGDETNHIQGLKIGGDDYLNKPISIKILITKIKKISEKINTKSINNILIFNNLKIYLNEYYLDIDSIRYNLPKKEFELLCLLASKYGCVFHRENILRSVWGNEVIVNDRTIDVHIRKIRKKIGIDCIQTIKGVGYKFEY